MPPEDVLQNWLMTEASIRERERVPSAPGAIGLSPSPYLLIKLFSLSLLKLSKNKLAPLKNGFNPDPTLTRPAKKWVGLGSRYSQP